MRRNTRYTPAYLLVLTAALLGFALLWPRAANLHLPRIAVSQDVRQLAYDLDIFGLLPPAAPTAPTERLTTVAVVESPVAAVEPSPVMTATVAAPAVEPTALAAEVPAASPSDYAYAPVSEVRHSNEDCPEPMIRGVVRNAAGELLPDVRIWGYDQFGNEEVVVSRLDEAERGQYALSVGDTANIYYLQVVDAAGAIISPVVEIPHLQGAAPDALCHWVDWQGQ